MTSPFTHHTSIVGYATSMLKTGYATASVQHVDFSTSAVQRLLLVQNGNCRHSFLGPLTLHLCKRDRRDADID